MTRSLTWFLIMMFLLLASGAGAVRAEAPNDFPPPADRMLPPKDFPTGSPFKKGPPPFLKNDELLKRAFEKHDPAIIKLIKDQIESKGPEGLNDAVFRAELKKKLDGNSGLEGEKMTEQLPEKKQPIEISKPQPSISQAGPGPQGPINNGPTPPTLGNNAPALPSKDGLPKDRIPIASGQPPQEAVPQKPGSVIPLAQAKGLIPGFDVKIDNDSGKVDVSGKIPLKCKSDFSLEASSSSDPDDVVRFRILDVTGNGLNCLKGNQEACSSKSSECIALAEAPLIFRKIPPRDCPDCGVPNRAPGAPEHGLNASGFGEASKVFEKREKALKKIKSMSCVELGKNSDPEKMMAGDLGPMPGKGLKGPPDMATLPGLENEIKDAMDEKMESCKAELAQKKEEMKRKMLRRIRSMPCPKPGEDMDDMDPEDMMANLGGNFKPPRGGRGHGGPPDMQMDSDFEDEIKDAMKKRMKSCMKKNAPAQGGLPSMAGGIPFGAGGANMMGMGGVGGLSMMGGAMPMMSMGMGAMGGMPFMGGGMSPGGFGGGMNMMSGMSMMGMPMMSPMGMSGFGGTYGGLGGYSMMIPSSPMMGLGYGGYGYGSMMSTPMMGMGGMGFFGR